MDYKLIISTIKAKRILEGIAQHRVSLKIGITQKRYSNMERGNTKLKLETYMDICKILKIDPVELLSQSLKNKGESS